MKALRAKQSRAVRFSHPRWRSLCHEDRDHAPGAPFRWRDGAVLTDGRAALYLPGHGDGFVPADRIRAAALQGILSPGASEQEFAASQLYEFCGAPPLRARPARTRCRTGPCRTCGNSGDGKAWRAWNQLRPGCVCGIVLDTNRLGRFLAGGLAVHRPAIVQVSVDGMRIVVRGDLWIVAMMGLHGVERADVRRCLEAA